MTTRTCLNCDAAVAENEQFCPACGQWVDPSGEDIFEPFTLEEGPPPDDEGMPPSTPDVEAPPEVTCPSCGTLNPAFNRHCEECGARIAQGPLPVAPQPAVRTTAGARALMVLAAVIMVVALAALLVNLFGSDDQVEAEPEEATTTTVDAVAIQALEPVSVTASSELPGFEAENLVDDDPANSWNDASLQGEGGELTFFFGEPVQITSIVMQNLTDEARYHRNFRIRGYQIVLDDLDQTISGELEDTMQPQTVQVPSLRTTRLTLRITSTYPAESWEGEAPFQELALQEVKFFGRPAPVGGGEEEAGGSDTEQEPGDTEQEAGEEG